MNIYSLYLKNYRNLSEINITPSNNVNVIYGYNGQGKTNLLEAIWIFTGNRSFRGNKDNELIMFGAQGSRGEVKFNSSGRNQEISFKNDFKKTFKLNEINVSGSKEISKSFNCIVFSPDHLNLIKEGPDVRRKFIDDAICQITPTYLDLLNNYKKILKERNTLLKDLYNKKADMNLFEVYEESLATMAEKIHNLRNRYILKLTPLTKNIYAGISKNKETFNMFYQSCFEKQDEEKQGYKQAMLEFMKNNREEEASRGITLRGPHREDLNIIINEISARHFGSQGQQRSAALALKLGEADFLSSFLKEKPIILLDDVMSELDENRQKYLLNFVKGWQIFITCCEKSASWNESDAKFFKMENGKLQSV